MKVMVSRVAGTFSLMKLVMATGLLGLVIRYWKMRAFGLISLEEMEGIVAGVAVGIIGVLLVRESGGVVTLGKLAMGLQVHLEDLMMVVVIRGQLIIWPHTLPILLWTRQLQGSLMFITLKINMKRQVMPMA